jgi:CBS domain-containing protein
MRVKDLLAKKGSVVVTVGPDEKMGRAVRLMMEHHVGGLPVAGPAGELLGFLSERNVAHLADLSFEPIREVPVRQAMSSPAPVCSTEDALRDVMARMTHERARHLVAIEGGRIAGVVSVGDLLKERLEELEIETGVLRDWVAAHRAVF